MTRGTVDALVIDALAGAEIDLRERLHALEADVESYQQLTRAALSALRDVTLQRDRAVDRLHQLHDEFRTFRARVMRATISEAA